MEFTKQTIADLTLPKGKTDAIWFDDAMPGFGIRLRASGKRVWLVQYRAGHKQRRETLGDARRLDLDKARLAAKKRFAAVTLGGDPQAEKAEARVRAKLTLDAVADRYLEFKQPTLRASTYNADKRYLEQHWKPLRGLPMHTITRRDVAARVSEIVKEHGATAAARARSTLSALFAWAMREGVADGNPVIGTNDPLAGKRSRDRVLDEGEIRTIWNACRDDDFGRIIKLLFLTLARREEIGGLRRHEIDQRGVLSIPGARTKNGRPLVLTLPPLAMSILESRACRDGREFVFGGRGGAFSAWSYSTLALNARIADAEGRALVPWRIHDIRRSGATHMAELGVQPHIIEAILNHVSGHKAGPAGIYNRATYQSEVKAALALWADHVRAVVEGSPPKVVSLHSKIA
jgi:integrase